MRRILIPYRSLNLRLGGCAVLDQAVVGGTNFLTAIFVGRLCGPSELGLFALATTTWYLILALLESLITSPFTVFVHRLGDEKRTTYAGSAIAHVVGLSMLAAMVLTLGTVLLYWIGHIKLAVVIAALAVTIPFRLLRQFARRFQYASLNLNGALVLDISVATLQMFALAVFYYFDFLTAAGAFLAVGSAYAIIISIWLVQQRRAFSVCREEVYVDFLKNWALGRWLAASQISTIAAAHSLPWIIAFALNESQAGIYFGCATLVRIGAPLLVAIQNVLVPRSAVAFAESGLKGLQHVVKRTTVGFVVSMGGVATLLAFGGDFLVQLFLGADYGGQQTVIALLALNELAFASTLGAASGLTVLERSDLLFRSHLAGILVTVATALALIGEYGLLGAAVAQLAGTVVGSVIIVFCYQRVVRTLREHGFPEQASGLSSSSSSTGRLVPDPDSA